MILVATHIITLVAFTVHAVLGCCAHHYHDTPTGNCFTTEAPFVAIDGHVAVDVHHQPVHSNCCGSDRVASTTINPENSLSGDCRPAIHQMLQVEFAVPCGDNHDCGESRCNFTGAPGGAQNALQLVLWSAFYATHQLATDPPTLRFAAQGRPFLSAHLPTGSHIQCVLSQSWQI